MVLLLLASLSIFTFAVHSRSRANESECKNNLRQLVVACHNYHDDYNKLPTAVPKESTLPYEERLSWIVLVEPYVESNDLKFDLSQGHGSYDASMISQYDFVQFRCPAHQYSVRHITSYVAIAGVGSDAPLLPGNHTRAGATGYERKVTLNGIQLGNGTAYTIYLGETQQNNGPWYAGGTPTLRSFLPDKLLGPDGQFSNNHVIDYGPFARVATRHIHFGMADWSVRQFSLDTTPQVLESLAAYRSGYRPEIAPWVGGD